MDTSHFIRGLTRATKADKRPKAWRRGKRGPAPRPVIDLENPRRRWRDTIAASRALKRTRQQVVNACNGWSVRCAGRRLAYVGSPKHRRYAA